MNWYLQNGKDSDIVICSKVSLSRNIKDIPFTSKCKAEDFKTVYSKMEKITPMLGYGLKFLSLKDMNDLTKQSLVEKQIISTEFAKTKNPYAAIIINDDENICIEVNEEDHIKLQVFSAGLDLENLMNLAIEIDQKLEGYINYSYHEKYGYLTSCPTNVGTGLKVSTIVHMPALSTTGNIHKIISVVNNLGMSINGKYGEESKTQGDLYQITNNQTLGVTEKEITKNLNLISQKVIEQERLARKYMGKRGIELEDKIYRNYGILSNAKRITEEETIKLLSVVKLGTDMGIIKELNDTKVLKLMLFTKSANMQKRVGKALSINEQDIERANVIKQILEEEG